MTHDGSSRHRHTTRALAVLVAGAATWGLVALGPGRGDAATLPSAAASAPVSRVHTVSPPAPGTCRAGRVALTFDDGPSSTRTTLDLVHELTRLDVPATFFVVGSRVAASPRTARVISRRGFEIGIHTYDHEDLTTLTDAQVASTLARTQEALTRAGVRTPVTLVRPPYGKIDERVRGDIERAGYTPVLWNVDSRDWTGLTTAQVDTGVVAAVRRLGRAGSVVLQHDGVTNSPASVAAVPREVRALRAAGYCFTGLGADGSPAR